MLGIAMSFGTASAADLPSDEDTVGRQERQSPSQQVDRVDPHSGNLTLHHVDLMLPGPAGLDITVHRTYDLLRSSAGLQASFKRSYEWMALGPGWTIAAAPRLYQPNPYGLIGTGPGASYVTNTVRDLCSGSAFAGLYGAPSLRVQLADGSDQALYPVTPYVARSKENWQLECTAGNLTLRSPQGIHYDLGNYQSDKKFGSFLFSDGAFSQGTTIIRYPASSETYYVAKKASDAYGNWVNYSYTQFGNAGKWEIPGTQYNHPSATGNYQLTRISSSDGREVTLTYDATSGRLQWIADNAQRRVTYAYSPEDTLNSNVLIQATGPTGEAWKYRYQPGTFHRSMSPYGTIPLTDVGIASRKLIAIERPEGASTTFRYSFVSLTVPFTSKHSSGKNTTTLAKRQERVVEKTLSTGQKWTYAYTRGGIGQYDTTQVSGPDGVDRYEFAGPGFSIATSYQAGQQTFQDSLWRVGKLIKHTFPDNSYETYQWQPREVSGIRDRMFELGVITDQKTWAADLQSRTVVRDGATYKTVYSAFDAYGNPGTRTETGPNGGSRTTTLTWHNDPARWIIGLPKDETSPGLAITRSYDANGKLLNMTRNGVPVSYTYDAQGNLASKTLPGNRVHGYANYKRGIAQHETQPEGVVIARVVDDAGNVTAYTDGEQHTTRYAYDGLNRVTAMTPPLGTAQTTAYTATSKTASRGALVETTQYDPFGRVASTTLGGITTRYEYDAMGRRSFVSAPNAATGTRYQYDPLGRLTRVTHADNSFQAIAYGPGSRSVTDERGQTTTYTYRAYGDPNQPQLMAIAAPEPSASVTLARDGADRLTTVTQGGKTRTYGYNANGYLTSVTQPETGTTTYGRDIAGNLTSRQVGASAVSTFAYDGQNRQVTALYPSDGHSIRNTYDRTGKLLASVSPSGNHSMTYDAAGNLASETVALDSQVFTARYAYNGNDQLSSITYPHSARVVSYSPDVLGRPTTVSGYVNNVSYWPSGMVRQITYANGTQSSYEQNARLWPASFSTAKTGVATYLNSAYGYDGNGNLLSVSDSVDGAFNRTLGYDAINRLTSVAGFWGAGSIAYDGGGNLLRQTLGGATLDYAYDAQNRLAAVSGLRAASLGYDAYGNVASSAGNSYRYNDVPNLVCINCATPASKIEYQYDGLNQRSSVTRAGRKVYEMHDRDGRQLIELDGGTLTEYFYLGDKRIAQRVTP